MGSKNLFSFKMVKKTTTITNYKKNYYLRRKKYFCFVAYNYSKAKLSTSKRIHLNSEHCQFITDNLETITVSALIGECPDWAKYRDLYLSYRLTGIKIECTPCPVVNGAAAVETSSGHFPFPKVQFPSAPAIGIIGTYDATTYQGIVESDKHITLSFTNKSSRYFGLLGGVFGWDVTNAPNEQNYKVAVNALGLPTLGEAIWNVDFHFYITFKSKI